MHHASNTAGMLLKFKDILKLNTLKLTDIKTLCHLLAPLFSFQLHSRGKLISKLFLSRSCMLQLKIWLEGHFLIYNPGYTTQ